MTHITLHNTDLERIEVIDVFDSFLWTDRYSRYGDFEIYFKASSDIIASMREDYYISMHDSEHLMIIESLNLKTDIEDGDKFIVKGRSLESILERRIIWKQTVLSGGLQTGIKRLLDENAIVPEDPDRKISRLVFELSDDPIITTLSIDQQYTGDNLYTVIQTLCESNHIGFKITASPTGEFVFKLYAGVDRSFNQILNSFVAFSPDLENLSNTNYYHSKIPYRSITLVAGEGEGSDRITAQVSLVSEGNSDLARREKFTDARDVSMTVDGEQLSQSEYNTLLIERGILSLLESQPISSFDGKVDPTTNYIYGEDFFIGDMVQIENEYGLRGISRITEITFSEDLSGISSYPTFEMIE